MAKRQILDSAQTNQPKYQTMLNSNPGILQSATAIQVVNKEVPTPPIIDNTPKPVHNAPPKVSSNFDRPNISTNHQRNNANPSEPIQTNQPNQPSQANVANLPHNTAPNKTKAPISQHPPPPPIVTHSYSTRMRARQNVEIAPIEFTPPIITTKQGKPVVIFRKHNYMVKFADK